MIRRFGTILGGLLVLATMSRPLGAQSSVVVDAGLTAARFPDDTANAAGPSLRLSLSGTTGRLFGSLEGGALGTFGASSGFATLIGGVRSSVGRGWSGELSGELATVAGSNSSGGAGSVLTAGRLLWNASAAGAWLEGSAHASDRVHSLLGGGGVETGAWWSFPRAQLSGTVTHQWSQAELYTGRFRTGFAGTVPVRFTEGALRLHAESDMASLDIAASSRRDPDAAHLFEQSFSASTALWAKETMAVVLTATHQLPDFVRGADAMDAVSIGLRFGQASPVVMRNARFIPIVQVADSGGTRVIRVHAAGARQVEVMGDFTDWQSRALVRNGSAFESPVSMSSGTHRLVVRIDGGAWRPAANTPSVDDDLGGRVGLLVVP